MTLEPLTSAPLAIQLHALAALTAVVLGTLQLVLPKGTSGHRCNGYVWAALMLTVAASGLFIHTIRMIGPFSPIHLLSLLILVTVPMAVWRARQGNAAKHGRAMRNIFWIALIGAGLFTLFPGRIMYRVLFSG
jgi:uncharacterized membrane protein